MQQSLLFDNAINDIEIPSYIHEMPKIDLHRHLLGSISSDALLEMANNGVLKLPILTKEELDNILTLNIPIKGLKPFFQSWPFLSKLVTSPDVVAAFTEYALKEAAVDNVIYTELRTSWGITGRDPFSVKEYLTGVEKGIISARQKWGIEGRVILGITRHLFSRHLAWQRKRLWNNILEAAIQFKGKVVVGFDVSGIEDGYPGILFKEELEDARKHGFSITIHCGETTGPEAVRDTINELHPSRLAHGLSIISDAQLMDEIKSLQLPIEICPSCNFYTQTISDFEKHPLIEMYKKGIKVTISTDNPIRCNNTSLSKEYALLVRYMGFKKEDIFNLLNNSRSSVFANEKIKEFIKGRDNVK